MGFSRQEYWSGFPFPSPVIKCEASEVSEVKSLSHVRLFATPWTVDYQAPSSMGFSRQECWSGLPFTSPGALPDPGIKPGSPALQVDALPSEPWGKPKIKISLKKKKKWCSNMPANLANSAVATGLEKVSFHSNPKERKCQRMFKLPHNHTHFTC